MPNDETIWFEVTQLSTTEKAVYLLFDEEGEELWVPRSQIKARKTDDDGKFIKVELTRWIAQQKGLLEPE